MNKTFIEWVKDPQAEVKEKLKLEQLKKEEEERIRKKKQDDDMMLAIIACCNISSCI